MRALRTPDERFHDLAGYPFTPHYAEVPDGEGGSLRMHYVDEGPTDAPMVLLLHGEPTWSYLYREIIPYLTDAGLRALAPDLIGFGKSDKPAERGDHTYQRQVDWTRAWLDGLDLADVTLLGHDWGGLIGLRLVAEQPDRFARVVLTNTGLPTGEQLMSDAFVQWREFSQNTPVFPVGAIVNGGCRRDLPPEVIAAYDAPFPDESYKAGARALPALVPISPDDPAGPANRAAWEVLSQWSKPLLTAFSDSDPITVGAERAFQTRVPGAAGRRHPVVEGAAHFVQEDQPERLARLVVDFVRG